MDWDPFVTPPMKTLKERLESAATPVSWTAGLLAESVWQAASSKGKANKRSREQYQYSFRAAWLKIADRMHLYEAARSLASKRSEEHTSELQSLMRISYAVFCLNKK